MSKKTWEYLNIIDCLNITSIVMSNEKTYIHLIDINDDNDGLTVYFVTSEDNDKKITKYKLDIDESWSIHLSEYEKQEEEEDIYNLTYSWNTIKVLKYLIDQGFNIEFN